MPDRALAAARPLFGPRPLLRLRGALAAMLAAALLAGCGMLGGTDDFRTVPNQPRQTSVDPGEAARMINAYRASRGRNLLTVDPTLNRLARDMALVMAAQDGRKARMHSAEGLRARLEAAGYDHVAAAENLGSGYPTLALALDGWRGSRGHNRNLLNPNVTHMGIGLAVTDKGPYKSYWVLILAKPDAEPDTGV